MNIYDAARKYLLDSLSALGPGFPAKVSQMLGEDAEVVRKRLSGLLYSKSDILGIIQDEIPKLFDQIDILSPAGAPGSFGQVNKAILKNGRVVAIKVQYPGMKKAIVQQLSKLLSLLSFATKLSKSPFNGAKYGEYFYQMFETELDYQHELKMQKAVCELMIDETFLVIPKVYPQDSNQRILTQEWINFTSIQEGHKAGSASLNILGQALCGFFLRMLCFKDQVYGDFHEGNVGLTTDSEIKLVICDFGSVIQLNSQEAGALRGLWKSLREGTSFDALESLLLLGFDRDILGAFSDRLPAACEVVFRPFIHRGSFDLQNWNCRSELADILGSYRQDFRRAGPPWFLGLIKTMSGFFRCLEKLSPQISLGDLVQSYMDQAERLSSSDALLNPIVPQVDSKRRLHIEVREGGVQKVKLEMPVRALEQIEDLMPLDIQARLLSQGILIREIAEAFLGSSDRRGQLFEDIFENKLVKITVD